MGAFSDKAFDIVRRIPRGRVMSYGAVARAIGEPRKSRFVGYAMRNNPDPDIYPCHRVVFKDGAICDSYVFGGPEVQKRLLEQEGVPSMIRTSIWRSAPGLLGKTPSAVRPISTGNAR